MHGTFMYPSSIPPSVCVLQLQEAGDVLVAMQRNRVVPEAATYNALISGHARQGQAREAFKLFNQVKRGGREDVSN